jgi:signal transduction histidine kinase
MNEIEVTREGQMDFGALLRHELNNPLTGILGNAELLLVEARRKDLELPAQAQARLETIAQLAVRMRETVRRLSEKCEAHAVEHRRESVIEAAPQTAA